MKNNNFTKVLFSGLSAVVIATATIGVNAALSDSPSEEPPGGLYSPTVENITVVEKTTTDSLETTSIFVDPDTASGTASLFFGNTVFQEDSFGNASVDIAQGSYLESTGVKSPVMVDDTDGFTVSDPDSIVTKYINIDGDSISRNNGTLYLQKDPSINPTTPNIHKVQIGSGSVDSDLTVYGDTTINGDAKVDGDTTLNGDIAVSGNLSMTGNLTANRFGTYFNEYSAWSSVVTPGSTVSMSKSCPTGTYIVSCGLQSSSVNTSHSPTFYITDRGSYVYISTNTCYVRGSNDGAGAGSGNRYVRASAVCLDPDL